MYIYISINILGPRVPRASRRKLPHSVWSPPAGLRIPAGRLRQALLFVFSVYKPKTLNFDDLIALLDISDPSFGAKIW